MRADAGNCAKLGQRDGENGRSSRVPQRGRQSISQKTGVKRVGEVLRTGGHDTAATAMVLIGACAMFTRARGQFDARTPPEPPPAPPSPPVALPQELATSATTFRQPRETLKMKRCRWLSIQCLPSNRAHQAALGSSFAGWVLGPSGRSRSPG